MSDTVRIQFEQHQDDLGYGMLLKRFTPNVVDATDAQITRAARDTIPSVALMFWTFRIMVGLGFWMLALIAVSFYYCARRLFHKKRWLLWLLVFNLPVPWIAAEMGWFVSEYGRQPWTIGEVLPTYLSASTLNMSDVIGSLIGLVVFYTVLLAVEMFLMVKFIRRGPSSLHTGQYHFELQE